MSKYVVSSTRTTHYEVVVEANSEQEAIEIVDVDFIDDDFSVVGSEFRFENVWKVVDS
jgi:hypothetical protein